MFLKELNKIYNATFKISNMKLVNILKEIKESKHFPTEKNTLYSYNRKIDEIIKILEKIKIPHIEDESKEKISSYNNFVKSKSMIEKFSY